MQIQDLEKHMGAVRFWHQEWWKLKRILVSNSLRRPGRHKHRNCFLSSKAGLSFIFMHTCHTQAQDSAREMPASSQPSSEEASVRAITKEQECQRHSYPETL